MQQLKVIISGGGTGGHIFPAIAIANAIKEKNANTEFLFVGAKGRMEMEKVPAAGYKIIGLNISGLQRKLTLKNLSFPFKVIRSLIEAKKILKQFKPNIAIGVGGYASGPMLWAAVNNKIPSIIQEQNSYPGITNKLLAKRVDKICVAYPGLEKYFPKNKIIITGNPVRKEVINIEGKKKKAIEFFGLNETSQTVLVIGGSLGARTINLSILNSLESFKDNNIQLLWQTGKLFINTATETIKKYPQCTFKTFDFINRMDYAYAAADIIISRAGAISVSELCLIKKPCILIPSPNVAEDHQTKNAMALVEKNAAILIKDVFAEKELCSTIINTLSDTKLCGQLSENISKMGMIDSAKIIAEEAIKIATNNNSEI
jgi:UDP-N-acetylglucosamine--N-acetylmuramyl-(pentapeptide) pyrophosphoryl-undecaprenol N-acetylglucosamine transferase